MTLSFSHAVGYHGKNSIDGTVVLCTGGNINLTQEPIMGSGVWGAGYANIAPIAWAWNYLQLEGSSNFELTTDPIVDGESQKEDGVWAALKAACVTDRTTAKNITLFPDGANGFSGNGWCSSLSIEASEGSALTGSYNFKGDPSGSGLQSGKAMSDPQWGGYNKTNKSQFAGPSLVPYWRTSMATLEVAEEEMNNIKFKKPSSSLSDIISWNVSYNSDLQLLKCCNLEEYSPISADYILCGEASADGSYTQFKIQGLSASNYHQRKQNLGFVLNMSAEDGTANQWGGRHYKTDCLRAIVLPDVLISSGSTSMSTGANYITTEYNFTGIGNSWTPLFMMTEFAE